MDQKSIAWIIKYRPKHISDVVGEESKIVKRYIDGGEIPHFLFESRTPGSGKTSLAKAIINDLGSDYLELNSSMDRGIDIIRDKIVHFVQTMSSKSGVKKIVFMDEFDGLCLPEDTEIITGSLENPRIKRLIDINSKKYVMIPSVNIINGKIENDMGIMVDSGVADFFELEMENGEKIVASANHPFFKREFEEIKLKDLKVGDEIIDMSDDIYNRCRICDKKIFKKRTCCSHNCANKLHSIRQKGIGNNRYGISLSQQTKEKISKANKGWIEPEWKKKKQSIFMKKKNPMFNYESRKKISLKLSGRIKSPEWIKKIKETQLKKLIDRGLLGTKKYEDYCERNNISLSLTHQRKKLRLLKEINCDICEIKIYYDKKHSLKETAHIHHIDKDRKNNSNENILWLCGSCHGYIHKGVSHNYIKCKNKSKEKFLNEYKKFGEMLQ